MKREYRITRSDLWFVVFREKDGRKEYLQNHTYTLNKCHARTFYHLNDAIGALQIEKVRCSKGLIPEIEEVWEDNSESIPEKSIEKQSWSEF